MNDEQQLKQFLSEHQYMVLAVTLDDGTPWATPVRVQLQWGNAFEWDSKLDTEHSKAIAKRPQIAITIFEKLENSQYGFYATAEARLLKSDERGFGRYQAVVTKAWVNDETFRKREVALPADVQPLA